MPCRVTRYPTSPIPFVSFAVQAMAPAGPTLPPALSVISARTGTYLNRISHTAMPRSAAPRRPVPFPTSRPARRSGAAAPGCLCSLRHSREEATPAYPCPGRIGGCRATRYWMGSGCLHVERTPSDALAESNKIPCRRVCRILHNGGHIVNTRLSVQGGCYSMLNRFSAYAHCITASAVRPYICQAL